MATITLTIPDNVYDAARIRAAEQCTSVSALVNEYLVRLSAEKTEIQRLLMLQEDLLNQIQARAGGFSASDRMTREQAHDRDALR